MTTENLSPKIGRPPGPSLAKEAVAILERNAFSALRGPNSRGAVPRSAFVEVDASTVDRSVKRAFAGAPGRTPFDLASHHVCSVEAGTLATLQSVFEAVEQSFRQTDEMETTLRVFLRANFNQACQEEGLLAAVLVQVAACAQLEHQDEATSIQPDAAAEILELRRRLYSEMADGFVAGLAIALRRLRRRPKAAHQLREIVVAVTATSDGFVLLHKLQPDLFDPELVVETQWGVIWSMTEPGLLDPPNQANPAERDLVEAALAAYGEGHVPSVIDVARSVGISESRANSLFNSEEALAQRCMDYAVGSSVETQAIAVNVKGAEFAAVRDLLIATTQQAAATPLLIEAIQRHKDSGFCAEARRHIAEALSQSDGVELDRSTAEGVALMLVDAALQGPSGKAIWETGLNAFSVAGREKLTELGTSRRRDGRVLPGG
jgi:hypothetical protein